MKSVVLTKTLHPEVSANTNEIPLFYFPKGKPRNDLAAEKELIKKISDIIGDKTFEITN